MLSRFYEISRLTSEGVPQDDVAQAAGRERWARDYRQLSGGAAPDGRAVDDRPRVGVHGRPADPGARSPGAGHRARSSTIRSTTSPSTTRSCCTASTPAP